MDEKVPHYFGICPCIYTCVCTYVYVDVYYDPMIDACRSTCYTNKAIENRVQIYCLVWDIWISVPYMLFLIFLVSKGFVGYNLFIYLMMNNAL